MLEYLQNPIILTGILAGSVPGVLFAGAMAIRHRSHIASRFATAYEAAGDKIASIKMPSWRKKDFSEAVVVTVEPAAVEVAPKRPRRERKAAAATPPRKARSSKKATPKKNKRTRRAANDDAHVSMKQITVRCPERTFVRAGKTVTVPAFTYTRSVKSGQKSRGYTKPEFEPLDQPAVGAATMVDNPKPADEGPWLEDYLAQKDQKAASTTVA